MLPELENLWGFPLETGVCEQCDWGFLAPVGSLPERCPHCFSATVLPADGLPETLPRLYPPELLTPFTLDQTRLRSVIETFQRGIPFAPPDLTFQNLLARLHKLYLPVWLADVQVQAAWQAEIGFNYQVVSHQERYGDHQAGWQTRQVEEGRVRWEPRAGRLVRQYLNLAAPALEDQTWLDRVLGKFPLSAAQAYQSQAIEGAWVRLPDRKSQDAWNTAGQAAAVAAASAECCLAAGGDHIRSFHWQPQFDLPNWTLLLTPIYSTYYFDDDGRPQVLLIHGQSGMLHGHLKASLKRAQRLSVWLLLAAIGIFLLSLLITGLGVLAAPLLPLGALGVLIAILLGLGSIIPWAVAWQFNRTRSISS